MPAGLFGTSKKTGEYWWKERMKTFAPINAVARSGGAAVGEVTVNAKRDTATGLALGSLQKGLGLHLKFDNADKIICCLRITPSRQ